MKEIRKAVLGQLLHKARQSEVDDLSGYFASGDCRRLCARAAPARMAARRFAQQPPQPPAADWEHEKQVSQEAAAAAAADRAAPSPP